MTTSTAPTSTVTPARRITHRAVRVLQILVGVFFVVASAVPKFYGDPFAIAIFDEIGAGQWLRYVVGALELAGGVGLLVPRFAGAAAIGLMALMVGAGYTQAVVLGAPAMVLTPAILFVACALLAWVRRDRITEILPARFRGDRA